MVGLIGRPATPRRLNNQTDVSGADNFGEVSAQREVNFAWRS